MILDDNEQCKENRRGEKRDKIREKNKELSNLKIEK